MDGEQRFLTKAEAAAACEVSEATIQRDRREGRYPNHTHDHDGTLLVPEADLVAAGRLRVAGAPGEGARARGRLDGELERLRVELAATRARAEQLGDEVAWLRGLVAGGAR